MHPYVQDIKLLIEEKRLELFRSDDTFNEVDELEDEDFEEENNSHGRVYQSSEIESLYSRIVPSFGGISDEKPTNTSIEEEPAEAPVLEVQQDVSTGLEKAASDIAYSSPTESVKIAGVAMLIENLQKLKSNGESAQPIKEGFEWTPIAIAEEIASTEVAEVPLATIKAEVELVTSVVDTSNSFQLGTYTIMNPARISATPPKFIAMEIEVQLISNGIPVDSEAVTETEIPVKPLSSRADGNISTVTHSSPAILKLDVLLPATPEMEKLIEVEMKIPPKSARPLPVDPFADFFTVDPSMRKFIDTLEKKQKRKKQQQKKQAKSGRSPLKKDMILEEDTLSLDIDEILRNRRQAEKAKEEARLKQQKEEVEKRLAAEIKKQAIKEERRRKREKKEQERQERETLTQQKIAAAAKESAAAAAAGRNRQMAEAEEADTIIVKLVTALSLPVPTNPIVRKMRFEEVFEVQNANLLSISTTMSLFDDRVAKESVPEEEDNDNHLNMLQASDCRSMGLVISFRTDSP